MVDTTNLHSLDTTTTASKPFAVQDKHGFKKNDRVTKPKSPFYNK